MRALVALAAALHHPWQKLQIEHHGRYSEKNRRAFQQYAATTTRARALATCLVLPLPCLLMMVLLDSIPVEPIDSGAHHSPMVWLRLGVCLLILSFGVLQQLGCHARSLKLTVRTQLVTSVVSTAGPMGVTYLISQYVGFPLPFMHIACAPSWYSTGAITLFLLERQQLMKPDVLHGIIEYHLITACQLSMVVVYPFYNIVFNYLTGSYQVAFVFVLPVLKIMYRNVIRLAISQEDDAKPEVVIFNVDIFHALFVSFCMQKSSSITSIFVIVGIDALQALVSVYDLTELTSSVQRQSVSGCHDQQQQQQDSTRKAEPVAGRAWSSLTRIGGTFIFPKVIPLDTLLEGMTRTTPGPNACIPKTPQGTQSVKACQVSPATRVSDSNTTAQATLIPADVNVQRILDGSCRLHFMAEFVGLVEYAEVIVPFVTDIYLLVLMFLPSRDYYPFIQGLDDAQILSQVGFGVFYATLELLSLVVLAVVVWRRLQISLFYFIAFTVETRMDCIAPKMMLWALMVMQMSIVQFGADYTFRFAWLKNSPPRG